MVANIGKISTMGGSTGLVDFRATYTLFSK